MSLTVVSISALLLTCVGTLDSDATSLLAVLLPAVVLTLVTALVPRSCQQHCFGNAEVAVYCEGASDSETAWWSLQEALPHGCSYIVPVLVDQVTDQGQSAVVLQL